ncbi:tyrosine-type recombinase/integrase [Lentzea sp. HUAS TT2]|uniref:tyrosine-type recombinase/integrase n=1 Tax=Lentzea sp. HUAS TT2 TaxID=3447454 RepID=UPI003F6EDBAF
MHLVRGVPLLHAEEQVFAAMLQGWGNQQLARNLKPSSIESGVRVVRRFFEHAGTYPWWWSHQLADEWFADLRTVHHLARSTLRGYQGAVRMFCAFITDPAYGWAAECERRFGTHPVQVVTEVNSAVHVAEAEAGPLKRAFTREELQALFDRADDEVARKRAQGRKGWLPAFRDATLLKTAYAFGLRRNETRMLDVVDFSHNLHGPEFGRYGVLNARYGKAQKGSPPKRRGVLCVWTWAAEVVDEWITDFRPLLGIDNNPALWPSERAARVDIKQLNRRLAGYRDDLGLDEGLDFHSLRRSYVTHLIEDGYDARFVQEQVGHEHASTTSIYTCVSSDYRTRTLRRVLDSMLDEALPRRNGHR